MVHNVSATHLKFADVLTISPNPTLSVYFSGLFDQFGWSVVRRGSCDSAIDFLRRNRAAVAIRTAVDGALAGGKTTRDLGGQLTTQQMTDQVIAGIEEGGA